MMFFFPFVLRDGASPLGRSPWLGMVLFSMFELLMPFWESVCLSGLMLCSASLR